MIEPFAGADNVMCTGVYAGMTVYDDATSSTGHKLFITKSAATACMHYKKRSYLSGIYVCCRPIRHVNRASKTTGAHHA
jgi:hypothetical protein